MTISLSIEDFREIQSRAEKLNKKPGTMGREMFQDVMNIIRDMELGKEFNVDLSCLMPVPKEPDVEHPKDAPWWKEWESRTKVG